jgi:hypothetical protein
MQDAPPQPSDTWLVSCGVCVACRRRTTGYVVQLLLVAWSVPL